jgi:DNA-binding GntR family transcriptional regulator
VHVQRLIEKEIVTGHLEPDERVTEGGLAERFGVSRTPVREAMAVLEFQGLIVRPRARGTYIAPRTTRAEARVLYEVRIELEGYLTGIAASRIGEDQLDVLRALARRFDAASHDLASASVRELITIDSDFHWTIYNAAETTLSSILSSYWARLQRELAARVFTTEDPTRFALEHHRLVATLEQRDAALANSLMTEHLRLGAQALDLSFSAADEE